MGTSDPSIFEIVGGRWSLAVVDALLDGPKRFTDLRKMLEPVSANILTQKLRDMERRGLVERRLLSPKIPILVYELTPWGYQGRHALDELRCWLQPGSS